MSHELAIRVQDSRFSGESYGLFVHSCDQRASDHHTSRH